MQETVEALWRDAEAMGAAVRQRGGKRLSRRDAGQLASNRGKTVGKKRDAGCLGTGMVGGKGTASSRAGKDADGEGYLLPIIRDGEAHARSAYRNVQYKVNQSLKEIGKMLGLKMPLTMYVARHSWASLAKSKEVPLSVISDGLGHASERVTRIYLSTLDMNAVDEANRMIINGI